MGRDHSEQCERCGVHYGGLNGPDVCPCESVPPRVPERVWVIFTGDSSVPTDVVAEREDGDTLPNERAVPYAPVSSGVDEAPAPCGRRFSISGCEWPRCADGEACQYASEEGCPVSGVDEKRLEPVLLKALGDPGQFVERRFTPSAYGGTDAEPLYRWQMRATLEALASVSREPSPRCVSVDPCDREERGG